MVIASTTYSVEVYRARMLDVASTVDEITGSIGAASTGAAVVASTGTIVAASAG